MFKAINVSLVMLSCILLLAPANLIADDTGQDLISQQEKESYSIGYQVGLSMKKDGVEIDFEKLVRGLQDGIGGKKPLLSGEEMKRLIVDLKQKARKAAMRKIQDTIIKNGEESTNFLEENGKKEGIKTTESGLQYKILKEGEGISPKPEDSVTVNYRGTFIDGTEFDSSFSRGKPQTFQTNGVIKGWTEALQMMEVGSKWEVFVPPDLAYGRNGLGERIPPNKVLVFEMELLSVQQGDDGDIQDEEDME